MKRMYSDLLKRVMVSIISLSMIIQPVVPAMAAESTDAEGEIAVDAQSDAGQTEAEELFTDADVDADMESVNDEESLDEVSGVEDDVVIAETEAVEDMEEALDAAGKEEDANGDSAVHVLDFYNLVEKKILTVDKEGYNFGASMTIPNKKTKAEEDRLGETLDGEDDPFFTLWSHNSSKTPVTSPEDDNRAPFPDGLYDDVEIQKSCRWSPNGPFGKVPGSHPTKCIEFTTTSEMNTIKIWWEGGGYVGNEMALYDKDQELVQVTSVNSGESAGADKAGVPGKGSYMTKFTNVGPGKWYLGVDASNGANYFYRVNVIEGVLNFTGSSWDDIKTPSMNGVNVAPVVIPGTAKSAAAITEATRKCYATINVNVGNCDIHEESAASQVNVYMTKAADGSVETMSAQTVKEKATGVVSIMKNNIGKGDNVISFMPPSSGRYFFVAAAERDPDSDGKKYNSKYSEVKYFDFIRPLDIPSIAGVTDRGDGTVTVTFAESAEADYYIITNNVGKESVRVNVSSTEAKSYYTASAKMYRVPIKATGLTAGKEYTFKVTAYRDIYNADDNASVNRDISLTSEFKYLYHNRKESEWLFSAYGTSTDKNLANNYYEGNANDGSVEVWAVNNGGKIVPLSMDGVSFYYTAVPKDKNFKISAKVHVNDWSFSNGQEGFGVMAADRVGKPGDTDYWNNSIMSVATKIEYRYDLTNEEYTQDTTISKTNMYLGLSALGRYGVTKDNLTVFEKTPAVANSLYFSQDQTPLDHSCAYLGGGTYNIVKNYCDKHTKSDGVAKKSFNNPKYLKAGLIQTPDLEREDFIMTVEKNNSGYFVSYTDTVTGVTETKKYYDSRFYDEINQPLYNDETKDINSLKESLKKPGILETLDDGYVYAGFFAARNADVTFNDISFSSSNPLTDPCTEFPEKTYYDNTSDFLQITNSNSSDFNLYYLPSWRGELQITNASGKVLYDSTKDSKLKGISTKKDPNKDGKVRADEYITLPVTLAYGANTFRAVMKPDDSYHYMFDPDDPYSDTANYNNLLKSYDTRVTTITVNLRKYGEEGTYLYVSPEGTSSGSGTVDSPLDIYTAVKYVQSGQQILLAGGEYRLTKSVRIERGIDGTKDNMIYLIPDPDDDNRPVFNFLESAPGFVVGGNYWYIKDIEIKNASDGNKGIQVAGSHCVLEGLETHHNGNNGIDISRLYSGDLPSTLYPDGVCKGEQIWPHDNLVLNCTSYENSDAGGEDADGFTCKLTVGEGNVFDGCIAYCNADDGWDLYSKSETGEIGRVTIKNSVAFLNGYVHRDMDGDGKVELISKGNGNGIKMGGEALPGGHTVINSFAFLNKAKGIDSNSCPDIKALNCISYANGGYNVAFYTNNQKETGYTARNLISFRNSTTVTTANGSTESARDKFDNYNSEGKADAKDCTSDVMHKSVFLWNVNNNSGDQKSVNVEGTQFDGKYFKNYKGISFNDENAIKKLAFSSVNPLENEDSLIKRNADGTIDMNGFLELTEEAYKVLGIEGRIGINGTLPSYLPDKPDYKGRKMLIDYNEDKYHPFGSSDVLFVANPTINTGVEDGHAGKCNTRKELAAISGLIASSGIVEKGTNDSDKSSVAVYPDVETIEPEADTVVVGRIRDQYYTGSAIVPQILVINGKGDAQTTLTRGKDYIAQFRNNVKAGVANVILTGKGNYKNKFYYVDGKGNKSEVTFNILPVPFEKGAKVRCLNTVTGLYESMAMIETDDYMADPVGKPYTPVPEVFFDNGKTNKKLKAGTDFTVSYFDANGNAIEAPLSEAGTYTIRITGTYKAETAEDGTVSNTGGNFTGSRDINYVIYNTSGSTIIDKTMVPKVAKQFLDKKGTRPYNLTTSGNYVTSVDELGEGESLVYPVGELKLGKDYVVSYSRNRKKGSAKATIVGIGSCAGKAVVKFSIQPAKLKYGNSAATVAYNKEEIYPEGVEYTGSAITINSMIKLYYVGGTNVTGKTAIDLSSDGKGKKLVLGKDYKITYKKAKASGTASAAIKGIGDYAGQFLHTYTISPISEARVKELLGKDLLVETQANQDEKYRAGYNAGTSVSCDKGYYVYYSKNGAKPDINVSLYGNILKNGRDYNVVYYNTPDPNAEKDDNNRSTYVITFQFGLKGKIANADYNEAMKAKGAAGDVNEMRYTIDKGELSSDTAYAQATDVVWKNNNTKIKTSFDVYEFESKKKLVSGSDYSKQVTYRYDSDVYVDGQLVAQKGQELNPKNPLVQPDDDGYNILVTISGAGRYEGAITTSIHVAKSDISKAVATKVPEKEWKAYDSKLYTGIELDKSDFEGLLVYGEDKTPLIYGKDYVIDTTYDMNRRKKDVQLYAKNQKVGQASVVIRGLGKYSGVRTVYYKIVPKPMIPEEAKTEEGHEQQQ